MASVRAFAWVAVTAAGLMGGCYAQHGRGDAPGVDAGPPPSGRDAGPPGRDAGPPIPPRRDAGPGPVIPPTRECAAALRCATLQTGELLFFDPLTGQVFGDARLPLTDSSITSFALLEDRVLHCSFESRGSLLTHYFDGASAAALSSPCEDGLNALTNDDTGFWMGTGAHYPDEMALFADLPDRSVAPTTGSRVGAGDGFVVGSWHSTDEVDVIPVSGGPARVLPLEGHDGWVMGIDVLDGRELIILAREGELIRFDLETGAQLGLARLPVVSGLGPHGLNCGRGPRFCAPSERP